MMPRKHIPYGSHNILPSDVDAVVDVLKNHPLTQGQYVPQFEKALANVTSAKYVVACNSATSALHIACLALGLSTGDYLWTSPISFVASANCGLYCGANVDFVDIDGLTGLISIPKLEEKLRVARINNNVPKILVVVHLCGASCDMQKIAELSREYKFFVIEDASHAVGGFYNNNPVGCCKYSDITVFSFHPVKIITTGEGGVALTNNPDLYSDMISLRSHGITKDPLKFESLERPPWLYEQKMLGFNYRMTDIHAALGISQLQRLNSIVRRRNQIALIYKRKLQSVPVTFLSVSNDVISSYHLLVVRLCNKDPDHHLFVFNNLKSHNIGVQLHYSPIHLQPYYKSLGFKMGDFPVAEAYSRNAISLPIYPTLTISCIQYVCEVLAKLA